LVTDLGTGEVVYEYEFTGGENISEVITSLEATGSYELIMVTTSYYGGAFTDNLTVTDLVTGNEVVEPQFFTVGSVANFSGPVPNWLGTDIVNGLVTFVDSGSNSGELEIIFDATGLVGGTYIGTIVINPNEPLSSQSINVTLNVTGFPAVAVDQSSMDFGPASR